MKGTTLSAWVRARGQWRALPVYRNAAGGCVPTASGLLGGEKNREGDWPPAGRSLPPATDWRRGGLHAALADCRLLACPRSYRNPPPFDLAVAPRDSLDARHARPISKAWLQARVGIPGLLARPKGFGSMVARFPVGGWRPGGRAIWLDICNCAVREWSRARGRLAARCGRRDARHGIPPRPPGGRARTLQRARAQAANNCFSTPR